MIKKSQNNFCSKCGYKLESIHNTQTSEFNCKKCNSTFYLDPKVAAVVIVKKQDKILLVKRSIEPHLGKWSLLSGYVNRGEKVEEAAIREVKEEVHIDVSITELQGVYSGLSPVVIVVFHAVHNSGELSISNEVSDFKWVKNDEIPELPFIYDQEIIKDYLLRIQNN